MKGLINCKVGDGLFEGEKLVSFEIKVDTQVNTISAIVNQYSIKDNKLMVDVYKQDMKKSLIGIPGESFSSRKIWIDTGEIQFDSK